MAYISFTFPSISVFFQLSEGNCSPDLYYDFMECVHGHIKEEWASLITDPDQHISKQEATMKKCFK